MARTPQRWGPLRQLEDFQREFDELFDRFLRARWRSPGPRPLPIVSYTEGDQLVIRADLPGVDSKDIEITVIGNVLRIAGKREPSKKREGRIGEELPGAIFERTITLPQDVIAEQITASYRNGVLEVRVPLARKPAAHKVKVRVEKE